VAVDPPVLPLSLAYRYLSLAVGSADLFFSSSVPPRPDPDELRDEVTVNTCPVASGPSGAVRGGQSDRHFAFDNAGPVSCYSL
jgi:hypothetical protein